jgi:hypothetical protein
VVDMQGAKKGVIVNSTNLCASRHRANARMSAQHGRRQAPNPLVRASGCKGKGTGR